MLAKWSGRRKAKAYIEERVRNWPKREAGICGPLADMLYCRTYTEDSETVMALIEETYTDETTRGLIPCKVKAHTDLQDMGINNICYAVNGTIAFRAIIYMVNSHPAEIIVTHENDDFTPAAKRDILNMFLVELAQFVMRLPQFEQFENIAFNVPVWPEITPLPDGNRGLRLYRNTYVLE